VLVPVGTAAWGMQDNNISSNEYGLKNQSPAVGATNIVVGKIDVDVTYLLDKYESGLSLR
jgi:hypothetical protein